MRAPPSSALNLSVSLNTDETYLNAGKSDEQIPSASIAASFAIRRFPLKIFICKTYSENPGVSTIFCTLKARGQKNRNPLIKAPVFLKESLSRLFLSRNDDGIVGKHVGGRSGSFESVGLRLGLDKGFGTRRIHRLVSHGSVAN